MEFKVSNAGQPYADLGCDVQNGWLYINWYNNPSLSEIRMIVRLHLCLQEETKSPFLLNDNTELITNFQELNDWVEEFWLPRAIENNLRYFAHVLSPQFFVKIAALDLHRRVRKQLEYRIFEDRESAQNWLKACQAEERHKAF